MTDWVHLLWCISSMPGHSVRTTYQKRESIKRPTCDSGYWTVAQWFRAMLKFSIFLKCLVTCGYVLASMMNFNITPIFLLNSGTVCALFQPPNPPNFPGTPPPNPRQGRCSWTPLGAAPPSPTYILFRPHGRRRPWTRLDTSTDSKLHPYKQHEVQHQWFEQGFPTVHAYSITSYDTNC